MPPAVFPEKVTMPDLTLVSHALCPYVQRAAIALAEKGVPFARIDVDLSTKPGWFTAISPLGKVPLLRVAQPEGEAVIFESAVILEYLEETQPNPLHPQAPLERARHRGWIEFGSALLNTIARLYAATTEAAFLKEAEALRTGFARLERELGAHAAGPYFAGGRFSLVDAVFGPIFRYFDTFEAQADLSILRGLPRIDTWRTALAARPSVRDAVATDYPDRLAAFLRERGSHLAQRILQKSRIGGGARETLVALTTS
jgi:glutathione S-transferase